MSNKKQIEIIIHEDGKSEITFVGKMTVFEKIGVLRFWEKQIWLESQKILKPEIVKNNE